MQAGGHAIGWASNWVGRQDRWVCEWVGEWVDEKWAGAGAGQRVRTQVGEGVGG